MGLFSLLIAAALSGSALVDDETKNYIYREGLDWMSRHTVLRQFSSSFPTGS
ncbi:hypothetical protein OESDEN_23580, partial [Oesophagostomum dentatum]